MTQEEIHPIKDGFVLEKTKVLIVGTFPPKVEYTEKGKDFFFYSSVKNQFWNRIDNIFPDQNCAKTSGHNGGYFRWFRLTTVEPSQ